MVSLFFIPSKYCLTVLIIIQANFMNYKILRNSNVFILKLRQIYLLKDNSPFIFNPRNISHPSHQPRSNQDIQYFTQTKYIHQEPSISYQYKQMKIAILLTVFCYALTQRIYIHSPLQLQAKYPRGVQIKLSPLGYQPRSGQLDGILVVAEPFDACMPINNVQNSEEDVFILVNDQSCLESVKSKNVVKGGGMVGIIRQNPNMTLHDKQTSIVHIPIIELSAQFFDQLKQFLMQNSDKPILSSLQFNPNTITKEITTELWMSPTETQIYSFLINMEKFLNNQKNEVSFQPRYALHSQKDRKSFIGCYSNGMYCPGEIEYDGIIEGQNILAQTLRQIVIRDMDMDKWWKYIKYYYAQCLYKQSEDVMMDQKILTLCTRNSMMLAGIDYEAVDKLVQNSFVGPRKQVDENILLNQQRQDYIRQKITSYPVMLINKKEFNSIAQDQIKMIICKIEHNRSTECSRLLDGDLDDGQIYIITGIVLGLIVLILVGYKVLMHRRMQTQMKGEVTSTLEQYYRYMETLEGDTNSQPRIYKGRPDSSNQIDENNQSGQQRHPQVQIELATNTSSNNQRNNPRNNPRNNHQKDAHQTLVEQQN